ncbi:histidine phosphatase family protein [Albimonas sp. CAU 1670]|uniref:histidine phosphatase family protein n=1 Tax=Albimonas sp. CAU 1670 TaxID=3032599 RepID=UPI0023DA641C|nr:histidine phosphatase family protein [Albimonas sp. CAU 1670]MDF2234305.1 histidine phosphatase family protein [Albimonas sp. CAU 1670]
MQIALLRHFPTDWNAEGRLQGRTDVPLSAEGRAELALRRLPEAWRDRPILCSPLSRARETAETLAEGREVRIDERLLEMDMGEWEGRHGPELIADPDCAYGPVEGWGMEFRAPGGEGPADMFARLAPLFAELREPTLLVTHRGLMRAALAMATGWRYEGPETFRIKRFALHPVTLEGGRPVAVGTPEKLPLR